MARTIIGVKNVSGGGTILQIDDLELGLIADGAIGNVSDQNNYDDIRSSRILYTAIETDKAFIVIDAIVQTKQASLEYMRSGISSNKSVFIAVSANYSAKANDFIAVTTGLIDRVMLFPPNPVANDIITIFKYDDGSGKVILDGNGKNINFAGTYPLLSIEESAVCHYTGIEWLVK